jgi:hypothetical protein
MTYIARVRSFRAAVSLAALIFSVACRNPAESGDPTACQQTYEFGNTGCFEVSGQIVGARGQALNRISVVVRTLGDFSTGATTFTDTTGSFRLRAFRMIGRPPAAGPDTASAYVIAADPRTAGLNIPATVRDSILVLMTLTPVGSVPTPAQVTIALRVP